MHARAEVVAARDNDGRTTLTRMRSQAPLVLRHTQGGVTLVAGAGGPLGGDDLALRVEVGDGASLAIGSAAATVVQPDRGGAAACLALDVHVGAGATLRWCPEPTVVADGATFRSRVTLFADPGAAVVWRDVLALGRHGEAGGTAAATLVVDVGGRPVLRATTTIGTGAAPGADGPAGLGGHRVLGSLLLLGAAAERVADDAADGDAAYAVLPLAAGGTLVTALGATTLAVRRVLDGLEAASGRGAGRR